MARGIVLGCEGVFTGIKCRLKKRKLLLDCVLVVMSLVPLELPMELSLVVNMSLVTLSKFGVYPAMCVGISGMRLTMPPPLPHSYLLH